MSVLFLLDSLIMGGSENKAVKIINHFAGIQEGCHLLYLNEPDTLAKHVSSDVNLLCLHRKGKIDLSCIRRYGQHLRKHHIEVVLCFQLYPFLNHFLSSLISDHKPRVIVSINITAFQKTKENMQMYLYKHLLRRDCSILFGSECQQEQWIERYSLPRGSCSVLYNGVDLTRFNPSRYTSKREQIRAGYRLDPRDIVLGMVAQFRPEKAHQDLLVALRRLIDEGLPVKALLAGDGPRLPFIQKEAEALGLTDRVTFLGRTDDIPRMLAATDIFVLTSTAVETFSNAALEAMAMAKPVVLSNVGGASEMVEAGVNGLLYNHGDVTGLASSISRIVRGNLYERMGRHSRLLVEERYSFDKMIDGYSRLLFPRNRSHGGCPCSHAGPRHWS